MSDNTSTYKFNEAEFESGRVVLVSHLKSNKHSGVNIYELASRSGVGRATDIRTLEAPTQRGVRRYNFSLGGRSLRFRHDRLH